MRRLAVATTWAKGLGEFVDSSSNDKGWCLSWLHYRSADSLPARKSLAKTKEMFLLNYFYGTKNQPCEQGIKPDEDWVLVDNNDPNILSTSLDDYGIVERDELLSSLGTDQLNPELNSTQPAINQLPPSSTLNQLERELGSAPEQGEVQPAEHHQRHIQPAAVQNPAPAAAQRLAGQQLKPRGVAPLNHQNTAALLLKDVVTATLTNNNKVKNNCKKQSQRRADKYKSGVWSGRSNDRKCGKCY